MIRSSGGAAESTQSSIREGIIEIRIKMPDDGHSIPERAAVLDQGGILTPDSRLGFSFFWPAHWQSGFYR